MSFSPFHFIFIGCIAYAREFFLALRNFDFLPTNEIFFQKRKYWTFRKWPFLGVTVPFRGKDELSEKNGCHHRLKLTDGVGYLSTYN